MSPRRLALGLTLVGAVAAAAPGPAHAGRYFAPLVAGAQTATGASFGTSLRLPLRTDEFQVIRRASRSTVTLGYPKTERVTRRGRRVTVRARPCATITYRLSLRPGTADPLAVVRAALPDADTEGTERGSRLGQPIDATSAPRRAWRIDSRFTARGLFFSDGLSVTQLRTSDPFGPPVDALRTVTMTARMLRLGGPCGGANFFTFGPGVSTAITGA